jgi:hypothetical protein
VKPATVASTHGTPSTLNVATQAEAPMSRAATVTLTCNVAAAAFSRTVVL